MYVYVYVFVPLLPWPQVTSSSVSFSGSSSSTASASSSISDLDLVLRHRGHKRDVYEAMSHESLVDLVVQRDTALRSARAEICKFRRSSHATRVEEDDESSAIVPAAAYADATSNDLFAIERRGRKLKHFSLKGSYALALRRSLSNIPAFSLGPVLLEDVSHQSVVRFEVELHAASVSASRSWHQDLLYMLQGQRDIPSLTIYAFRGDATNANVWQNAKLHGLQLQTTCISDVGKVTSAKDFLAEMFSLSAWADPQRQECGSAEALHAMIRKQIRCLGAPVWPCDSADDRDRDHDDGSPRPEPGEKYHQFLERLPRPAQCTLWAVTSDGGGDQIKCRRRIKHETRAALQHLVIDRSCLFHINALITKSGLTQIDRWYLRNKLKYKYYAAIAKVVHIWRDCSRAVYTSWIDRHGAASANLHARTMVPKCIAGRWQSIHITQERILAAGQDLLPAAMLPVIELKKRKPKAKGKPKAKAKALALADAADAAADAAIEDAAPDALVSRTDADELVYDPLAAETAHYREKMGKYRRDSSMALRDSTWWRSVDIMTRASKPLQHHHRLAHQKRPPEKLAAEGNASSAITCGGGLRIFKEFEAALFDNLDWADDIVNDEPLGIVPELLALQVELILHHAAAYFRRVVRPASEFSPQRASAGNGDRAAACCCLRPAACCLRLPAAACGCLRPL